MVRTLAVTSSPSDAVAARRRLDELAVLVAQRDRQAVDLRLGGEGERRRRRRAAGSGGRGRRSRSTSSSSKALPSDSIGTRCGPCRSLRPAPRRRAATGCRRARARESAPRSPRCAGAARRTRRRRSPARPAGDRARRDGDDRGEAAQLGLGLARFSSRRQRRLCPCRSSAPLRFGAPSAASNSRCEPRRKPAARRRTDSGS